MHNYETIIGEAIRVEYTEFDDRVCVVFEITHPKIKKEILTTWAHDIEFKMMDKKLILEKKEA
jgi:hypothetical protein